MYNFNQHLIMSNYLKKKGPSPKTPNNLIYIFMFHLSEVGDRPKIQSRLKDWNK